MARPSSKEHVVSMALREFRQRGYDNVSLRDIAQSSGLTKAAVYYHFPTKAQILKEIAEPVLQRFEAALQALEAEGRRPDPREVFDRYIDVLVASRGLCAYLFSEMAVARDEDITRQFGAQRLRFQDLLAAWKGGAERQIRLECAIALIQEASRRFDLDDPGVRGQVIDAALGAAYGGSGESG